MASSPILCREIDPSMHHQLNDATGTVSASCTISTSVKPELSVADERMMHAVRNDQPNLADLTFSHNSESSRFPFDLHYILSVEPCSKE